MMNRVARYRGTGEGNQVTREPGYIYTNKDGLTIINELKQERRICDKDYVDTKLDNTKGEQSASNADIASIQSRLDILEEKVSALKKTNTEVIASESNSNINFNDNTKDYILSGETEKTSSITCKSVEIKNMDISLGSNATLTNGNAVLLNASEDVEIKSSNIEMNNPSNNNCVKVQNADTLIIRDTEFNGTTYNTIMTGQNSTAFIKYMLIDNCDFNEDCKHINIWFAGHADNAVLTISNCHFKTSEQFLCISDFADSANKLTVNIINCSIDNYDNSNLGGVYGYSYAGFMFIESRNIGNYETLVSKNPFGNGKVVINIENLIVKGVKVTEDNFYLANGEANQSMYFYHQQSGKPGCIKYNNTTKDLFPTINIK